MVETLFLHTLQCAFPPIVPLCKGERFCSPYVVGLVAQNLPWPTKFLHVSSQKGAD